MIKWLEQKLFYLSDISVTLCIAYNRPIYVIIH